MNNNSSINILIIDDNEDFCEMLKKIFESVIEPHFNKKFIYHLKNDLNSSLIALIENDINLILVDYILDYNTTGIDIIKNINSQLEDSPPTIFVTGNKLSENDINKIFETGAIDIIKKPINIQETTWKIKNILKRQINNLKKSKKINLLYEYLEKFISTSINIKENIKIMENKLDNIIFKILNEYTFERKIFDTLIIINYLSNIYNIKIQNQCESFNINSDKVVFYNCIEEIFKQISDKTITMKNQENNIILELETPIKLKLQTMNFYLFNKHEKGIDYDENNGIITISFK